MFEADLCLQKLEKDPKQACRGTILSGTSLMVGHCLNYALIINKFIQMAIYAHTIGYQTLV